MSGWSKYQAIILDIDCLVWSLEVNVKKELNIY